MNDEHLGILNELLLFLKDGGDVYDTVATTFESRIDPSTNVVLFVSCNWYDTFKAPIVASAAREVRSVLSIPSMTPSIFVFCC